ncbi:helix-turn-helix domain-containing protein [Micromonospora sp. PLK6-60]|nr:helix-turn-helix domain-containing protein [Micromonospora sp. PLK6-60]
MTQQQFADRLGKSKSWVDKVERGVRNLERVSSLREVADVLRIDVEVLLADRDRQPSRTVPGVARVRAALARYHVPVPGRPADVAELRARLAHAEQTYRHARYPALLVALPDLLGAARAARAARPGPTADGLLVAGYGLVALALLKVDQGELAWLAADRGMAVAAAMDDPGAVARATVPLSQVLRFVGRRRSAREAAVVAARRLASAPPGGDPSPGPSLLGTLFVQAALAAAGRGDERGAEDLLDRAASAGDTGAPGRAAVEAARVVAAASLGDVTAATVRHERLIAGDEWRWLPPEHRAAYLLDAARAYAVAGDPVRAGRTVLEAERTAHGEVHDRPAVRELVAVVARTGAATAALDRLAATLHVT